MNGTQWIVYVSNLGKAAWHTFCRAHVWSFQVVLPLCSHPAHCIWKTTLWLCCDMPVTWVPPLPGLAQFELNLESHIPPPLSCFLLKCGFKKSPLSRKSDLYGRSFQKKPCVELARSVLHVRRTWVLIPSLPLVTLQPWAWDRVAVDDVRDPDQLWRSTFIFLLRSLWMRPIPNLPLFLLLALWFSASVPSTGGSWVPQELFKHGVPDCSVRALPLGCQIKHDSSQHNSSHRYEWIKIISIFFLSDRQQV